jgi:hypothetical protein
MKNTTLLFLFMMIFCKANAQDEVFRQMSEHTFIYNGRIGELHTFKDVMLLDSANLYNDFYNFNKHRKSQREMNIVFSVAAAPFFIGAGYIFTSRSYLNFVGYILTGIGSGFELLGFGISGLTYAKAKNKHKKLLLGKVLEQKKETSSLRLGATPSGVGLVVQF